LVIVGATEALLEHDIAALRSQRRLDGVRQHIHAAQHARAGVFVKNESL